MTKRIKKKKCVVLDCDDVILDFMGMLCFLHNQLHKTVVSVSHFNEYDIAKINFVDANGIEVDGADILETFHKYEMEGGLYALLEPLNHAREALSLIDKLGYHIVILTARKPEFELQTIANLAKYKVYYDDLIFTHEKAKMIRKLSKTYNIVAFADDKASTVRDVFENTNVNDVYLVNQPHNSGEEMDEEITRLNKLFDLVQYLRDVN